MVNDPIGDMLAQIKNAVLARQKEIEMPFSKVKLAVAQVLVREGYLTQVEKVGQGPKFKLHIGLAYRFDAPTITDLKRQSKPGLRVYVACQKIPSVVGGLGIAVISTSQGIMTGSEAKKRGLGGELLCEIW